MRIAVVVNPVSGGRAGAGVARRRAGLAVDALAALGHESEVLVTERPGHAADLAAAAIGRGAQIVCAWGGDGTVNEVGRAVAFTDAALGIVPAGSGNGLARALQLPRDPRAALRTAASGSSRRIDAGEIGGRLFFNVAGLGFDAHVAREFARSTRGRGLRRYAAIVARELFTYSPRDLDVDCDGVRTPCRAFLLTFANGPQWGNGAIVAPDARLDDGLLDLVVVEIASRARLVRAVPSLFSGRVARQRGVRISKITQAEVVGRGPLLFHVDGEPAEVDGDTLTVIVRPGALLVRC